MGLRKVPQKHINIWETMGNKWSTWQVIVWGGVAVRCTTTNYFQHCLIAHAGAQMVLHQLKRVNETVWFLWTSLLKHQCHVSKNKQRLTASSAVLMSEMSLSDELAVALTNLSSCTHTQAPPSPVQKYSDTHTHRLAQPKNMHTKCLQFFTFLFIKITEFF